MLTYNSSHTPSTDDIILSSTNLTVYFMRRNDPLESSFQNLSFTLFCPLLFAGFFCRLP